MSRPVTVSHLSEAEDDGFQPLGNLSSLWVIRKAFTRLELEQLVGGGYELGHVCPATRYPSALSDYHLRDGLAELLRASHH